MADIQNSLVYKVVGFGAQPEIFQQRLVSMEQNDYDTLMGICARLAFIDQVEIGRKITGWNIQEHALSNQFGRLKLYLTITCIDVITGIGFEQFHDWLNKEFKTKSIQNSENWKNAIEELTNSQSSEQTEQLFRKHINEIYNRDYLNSTSKRRAIKGFVKNTTPWLKDWLCNLYVINFHEQVNSQTTTEQWANLSPDKKSERIAEYLYRTRNLYTHTVIGYESLNFVQPVAKNISGIEGYIAIWLPVSLSSEKIIQVSLPVDYDETEVIRLLIVNWIRKNWLKIDDDESFIQKYWQAKNH